MNLSDTIGDFSYLINQIQELKSLEEILLSDLDHRKSLIKKIQKEKLKVKINYKYSHPIERISELEAWKNICLSGRLNYSLSVDSFPSEFSVIQLMIDFSFLFLSYIQILPRFSFSI